MKYVFRAARATDLPAIMEIIDAAVERMLSEGKRQWDETYPTASHIINDITSGFGYLLVVNGHVAAYGAIVTTGEPAYDSISDGDWITEGQPYVTIHRLAVDQAMQCRGIASRFIDMVCDMSASQGIGSIRVDTNFDNERMLRLLDSKDFERCGMIKYEKGERIAFEKLI